MAKKRKLRKMRKGKEKGEELRREITNLIVCLGIPRAGVLSQPHSWISNGRQCPLFLHSKIVSHCILLKFSQGLPTWKSMKKNQKLELTPFDPAVFLGGHYDHLMTSSRVIDAYFSNAMPWIAQFLKIVGLVKCNGDWLTTVPCHYDVIKGH